MNTMITNPNTNTMIANPNTNTMITNATTPNTTPNTNTNMNTIARSENGRIPNWLSTYLGESGEHPDCPIEEGWDFVSTKQAGLDDFGCRSHGGTSMTHYEVCRNTGVYMDTWTSGAQRNPGEETERVTYRDPDERSLAMVREHHTDEDGHIPEWLSTYLGESVAD